MRKLLKQIAATLSVLAASATLASGGTIRLVAFGDSLVQGYGLAQAEGLVPQLQGWLRAQGADVEVGNAGVSGDTSAGGAARIDWTLSDQPDGLIVVLGGNDLLRGLPPEALRANLTHIIAAAQSAGVEVMLVGIDAPLNYGADYKQGFDAVYTDLARSHDVLLHPSVFAGIAEKAGEDPAAYGRFMQNDGIHPNALGVAANVEALGPVVLQLLERIKVAEPAAEEEGRSAAEVDGDAPSASNR
ncbi:arylesterase [Phaeobacter sp. B1627]|uniref:arylesterase n=1 Tax=Phaeobacter sp. B1627 TaxID=2583809 RepID=UPI00111B3F8E|nr:arylesterase [Phaeobacter sp. B1627]TNJ44793.1 arylesterase [Phaeobacter sp. B1627]